jgi:hypothetical protein
MDSVRKPFSTTRTLYALIVALSIISSGCSIVKSESDILGEYELRVGQGKIGLKMLPDKSFSETIYWPNGKVQNLSGKWIWAEGGISFNQLWIPPEFAPDYILQADSSATANRQPKYTEPGHWSIRAEKHWGTVTLPIFPDADTSFQKIKRGWWPR